MAASYYVGEFVPSEKQLSDADVLGREFAFFAAKVLYWQCRDSLYLGNAASLGFAAFLKAVENRDRARADEVLRYWRVRRSDVEASLPRNPFWTGDLPTEAHFEAGPVDQAPMDGLLL